MSSGANLEREFKNDLNIDNAKRLQVIAIVIMTVVGIQAVTYMFSHNELYGMGLIRIKVIIFLLGIILLIALQLLRQRSQTALKFSMQIIFWSTFFMVFLSIINTFYAQQISNDISIYILILMAVIASSRMDGKLTFLILFLNYLIFAIGMSYFQPNQIYLFSHRFNGALLNILGFIISRMFYQYNMKDYKDRLESDKKNEKLKELSEKDDLTGLFNKRTIYMHLVDRINKAKISNASVYLGILDLDHFKDINDRYGHLYGDDVLKLIANKILGNVREEDIVGRYGGDEFVVIFYDIEYEQVHFIMQRLLDEVNKLEFDECKLSFSCGIAVWRGESSEKLFERADAFMYDVKKFGKNDIKIEELKDVI